MKNRNIVSTKIEKIYSLTKFQSGILYHYISKRDSTSYILQYVFDIKDKVNIDYIKEALKLISQKHSVLRTAIVYEKIAVPKQVILKNREIELELLEASICNSKEEKEFVDDILSKDLKRGFDLQKESLLRTKVVSINKDKYKFIWSFHHIIMDGWCVSIVFGDFMRYYKALLKGVSLQRLFQKVVLERKQMDDYSTYVKWINNRNQEEGLNYWKKLLSGYEEDARIRPTMVPQKTNLQMCRLGKSLNSKLTKELIVLANENKVTLNVVAEAAWAIILQKYSYTKDVVFGKVVSGRNAPIRGIDKIVGLFINTIPIRIKIEENTNISMLLKEIQEQDTESEKYDINSLAEIQSLTKQGRNLINTLFAFENYYIDEEELKEEIDNVNIQIEFEREQTNYDINICVRMEKEELHFDIIYNPNQYLECEIERILLQLKKIFELFVRNNNFKISNLDWVTEKEKEQIFGKFNDTEMKYPKNKTVVELFEEQVKKSADKIAVIFGEKTLTYQKLNEKANSLAHILIRLGVEANDFVVILAERSIEMIVGIYGIQKAGGAYVPIDIEYPKERIQYILDDVAPKAILVYKMTIDTNIPVIDLSESSVWKDTFDNPKKRNKANDLAYCIYTSGTTGKPKGVMVEHHSLSCMNQYLCELYNVDENDYVLQFSNYAFDASVWEMTLSLMNGAKLVLISADIIADIDKFNEYVKRQAITLALLPPQYFLQSGLKNLKVLTTGGSATNSAVLKKAREHKRYINAYGPTENTVIATCWEPKHNESKILSIGKPIKNTQIYILDGSQLCGLGMPGELCITGDSLARGYLNRPKLTAEKFVDNPFGEGKMYRSGDLARWLLDGNIEYLGRIDEQVKIRGFRIELGEIESIILKINNIKDCAVIAREESDGDKVICAYLVADEKINILLLKEELRKLLPEYMIPVFMIQIDSIPVTRNGKIDKKLLMNINIKSEVKYVAPRNEIEKILCRIYEEILEITEVGIKDNFFELGGHSLRVIRLINQIEAKIGQRITVGEIFSNPDVESIANLLERNEMKQYIPISKAKKKNLYPMSSSQKRTYIACKMNENGIAYNMPIFFRINGNVNIPNIKLALQKISNRHEILRTEFLEQQGKPMQKILNQREIEFICIEDKVTEENILIKRFVRPFNLKKDSLVRVELVKRENNYLFMLDMHHIIGDGMSMGTFMKEFAILYNGGELSPLQHQYKDYSEWMQKRDLSNQKEYWLKILNDEIPILDMPLDHIRPQEQSYNGAFDEVVVEENIGQKIKKFIRKTETTEYMFFLSTLMILLSKYSKQEDIIIGSPISGRIHKDTEEMLGMFINTLAMRGKPESNKTYMEFLYEIKESCLKAYENQEYPFEELVENINIQRDISRNPVFDVMFVMQNNESISIDLKKTKIEQILQEDVTAKCDLTFNICENDKSFVIILKYCKVLFDKKTIEQLLKHYINILIEVLNFPEKRIEEINMLSNKEKNMILEEFNNTDTKFDEDKTLVEMFEEQVEKTPDYLAIIMGEKQLTYRELNNNANILAHKLREYGVKPDDLVAIIAQRSIEMIVGIFGILKSGAAYVPIDPVYPKERIQYILEDCNAKVVLTYRVYVEPKVRVIDMSKDETWTGNIQNPKLLSSPENVVYCIYTSGTTGKPKGVLNLCRGLINRILWMDEKYPINEGDTIIQKTNYSFDVSVCEIFGWSIKGGKVVVLPPEEEKNPMFICDIISKYKVPFIHFVPSMLNVFLAYLKENSADVKKLKDLKYLFVGGEKLNASQVKEFYEILGEKQECLLVNCYGPTEAAIDVTSYECHEKLDRIPIGKPIWNTKIYIMNKSQLCGIGVPGELCITGVGLAKGYLNNPELTAKKFVKNPFGKGMMYCTGDFGRWLTDGNIEYLGRIDEQVKIRGFRIELGDIENAIRQIKNIKDCAVIVKENKIGNKTLHMYFVSEQKMDLSYIRNMLAKLLPEYMIPNYMMQIDYIPVTRNGKLDKRALPEIEIKSKEGFITPRNKIENVICNIFQQVLQVKSIGIRDNFFALGGDSIQAIRIVSKMREVGYEITVKDIMRKQTVEAIALIVSSSDRNDREQNEVTGKVISTPIINEFKKRKLVKPYHYNQAIMVKIEEEEWIIKKALNEIVRYHDMLRAVYKEDSLYILSSTESKMYDFEFFDLLDETDEKRIIEVECARIQSSISLEDGPLMKVGMFQTVNGLYMMICLHHLIVDGVSWRILMDDFELVVRQIKNREQVILPTKTISFKEWACILEEYKNTPQLLEQEKYWKEITSKIIKSQLVGDSNSIERGIEKFEFQLGMNETEELLYQANQSFNTEINDLLIAAIGMAIKKLTGQEKIAINLEGHGRENLHRKVNIDRTVGWFTSIYPIIVRCYDNIEESIINTKEMLHKIPNHGIGYGLLREKLLEVEAEVSFNYLGQLDLVKEENIVYSIGDNIAKENRILGNLNITGAVLGDRLCFTILFAKEKYLLETVERFTYLFKESLENIIVYCIKMEKVVFTPSDFTDNDLSIAELRYIEKVVEKEKQIIDDIYPLTPLQEGILFHNRIDEESTSYVIQTIFNVSEKIDEEKVEQSLELLSARHDVLRTMFVYEGIENSRQIVLKTRKIGFKIEDLSQMEFAKQKKKFHKISISDVKHGFNLQKEPLMRVIYVKMGEQNNKLIWSFHHIIMDGWCLSIVFRDFIRYYQALIVNKSMDEMYQLIERERQETGDYRDYIKWMYERNTKLGVDYWRKLLCDYENDAQIVPTEKPKATQVQMKRMGKSLNSKQTKDLIRLAINNDVTLNTVVEVAWGILLQKYSYTNDVVFGKVISGRNVPISGAENIVGLFINTIPVRIKAEEMSIKNLLKSIQEQNNESSLYDGFPLVEIQSMTKQGRQLIRTLFVFENYYIDREKNTSLGESIKIEIESAREQTNYDINMSVSCNNEELKFDIVYNPNKYLQGEIERILLHFARILEIFIETPSLKVSEIELITEVERKKILDVFNNTQVKYPKDKTIVDLFEEQVRKTPDNVAVIFENQYLTYTQLNEKINMLAYKLRKIGVQQNDFVAILVERSIEMIIGIYGILKAGGAYVPIDPEYPEERIQFILQDSEPKIILIYNTKVNTKIPTLDLSNYKDWKEILENPEHVNKATDLAYCIYTSGTTGNPKGVMVEHRGILSMRGYLQNSFKVDVDDYVLQFANYVFDQSVWEMNFALLTGAKLVLIQTNVISDINMFNKYVKENKITIAILPPQYFLQSNVRGLKFLATGGTPTSFDVVLKARSNKHYLNAYGPTESTVIATCWEASGLETKDTILPIGRPIDNTRIYILNQGQLCGIGVPGEICIAGDGLARGYLKRKKLNEEKFILNPYSEGRLYRSGDLGRWLPDGNIEYLGRIDEQVKIRGFRIELGEIESAIRKIKVIKDAAVITRMGMDSELEIYAYFVSDEQVDISNIKEVLKKSLPEYMIPTYMAQIESIPVNQSGKLDKKSLPQIIVKSNKSYVTPQNQIEVLLCKLYSEILGVEQVGVNDSFFELGGHSIRASHLINQIEKETGHRIRLKDIFGKPTIRQIAEIIMEMEEGEYISIPKAQEMEYYTMSSTQKRIYFVSHMAENSVLYNMSMFMRIKGDVKLSQMRIAFQKIMDRHEILRTEFHMINGEPVQKILIEAKVDFLYIEDMETELNLLINQFIRPFDLESAPLFRVQLVKRKDDEYLFMIDMHHIIGDGISMGKFINEFTLLYNNDEVKKLTHQYKDYSEWMKTRDLSKQKEYWLKQFGDEIPILNLPLDYMRPQEQSYSGSVYAVQTGETLGKKIKELGKRTGTTEYMVFLSAVMVLLGKYSKQEDIVIGSPISGRIHKDTEYILGMFVNTLAMRGMPRNEKRYIDFLDEIKEMCLKAYENQEYPFEELIENINVVRDMSRNPLFDVMLVLQNNEMEDIKLKDVTVQMLPVKGVIAKFDLTFNISENQEGFCIALTYCTDLFKENSIHQMLKHYISILEQITSRPEQKIRELKVLTKIERELILENFNNTKMSIAKNKTVIEYFEEQVVKTPNHIAVEYGNIQLTYKKLNEKANIIAHKLRILGVQSDTYVAIIAERSIEMIVGIYGILKSGGAYVPIDPDYPKVRIDYILSDCVPKAVLTYKVEIDTNIPVIDLSLNVTWKGICKNPKKNAVNKSTIYCIYTSGTTGKPKGVVNTHEGIDNLITWLQKAYPITEEDAILQKTTYTFDVSVSELFWWSRVGAKLVILKPGAEKEPDIIIETIQKYQVSVINFVPSMLSVFLNYVQENNIFLTKIRGLKYILAAGEALNVEVVKQFHSIKKLNYLGVDLINLYGPTEASVYVSHYNCKECGNIVPIGKPITNIQLYILDDLQLCGLGVPGELCIAGLGLARGYLNNIQLTKEKFVNNPFGEGKIYRTGDLARWLPDGNIEYLGRIDEQVKIRGFRIELGEIENNLRKIPIIQDCAVIIKESVKKGKAIHAYIVSEEIIDIAKIREMLRELLPEYMIPSYIMQIDTIPITRNGKVNKKVLPEIILENRKNYIPPINGKEQLLCQIFEEVLSVNNIGVLDDFFELGGDSLKVIKISALCKNRGLDISIRNIIQYRNIRRICKNTKKIPEHSIKVEPIAIGNIQSKLPFEALDNSILNAIKNYEASIMCQQVVIKIPTIVQKYFYNERENICYNIYKITGDCDDELLQKAIMRIIQEQECLRMSYDEVNKVNKLFECSENSYVISIIECENEDKFEKMISTVHSLVYMPDYFFNKNLLAKIIIIKLKKHYQIHIIAQHSVWDSMSFEIFKECLLKYLNNIFLKNNKVLVRKREQVSILESADCKKTKNSTIIKQFNIEAFVSCAKEFVLKMTLQKRVYSVADVQITLNNEQKKLITEKPLEFCILVYSKLLMYVKKMNNNSMPYLILHHGRDKEKADKLGTYLKLIPYIYFFDNKNITNEINTVLKNIKLLSEEYLEVLLEKLDNTINFLPIINYGGIFNFDFITNQDKNYTITKIKNNLYQSKMGIRASFINDCLYMQVMFPEIGIPFDLREIVMEQIEDLK